MASRAVDCTEFAPKMATLLFYWELLAEKSSFLLVEDSNFYYAFVVSSLLEAPPTPKEVVPGRVMPPDLPFLICLIMRAFVFAEDYGRVYGDFFWAKLGLAAVKEGVFAPK